MQGKIYIFLEGSNSCRWRWLCEGDSERWLSCAVGSVISGVISWIWSHLVCQSYTIISQYILSHIASTLTISPIPSEYILLLTLCPNNPTKSQKTFLSRPKIPTNPFSIPYLPFPHLPFPLLHAPAYFCDIIYSQTLEFEYSNMLKKPHPQKKKPSSTTNLFLKVNDKTDKINLKFALNMYVPRVLVSPKANDPPKHTRSGTATPKPKPHKKPIKQNGHHTAIISKDHSYISTPFQCEPSDFKQRNRNDFKFMYQVGSGGFGRVWKVQEKKSNQIFAMKEISKAKVLLKKSVGSVINQKTILEQISNPFIINMKSSFQDREYLYMTMEYLRGGDLRYHLCFYEFFNEEQTKFLVGCIILGLEFIHSKGIIHRDLKPQNLVFEENGYLRITDFGVARKRRENNSEETSGTPGYMAPEVICRMNHSFQADFFALGVMIYQIMLGSRPYMGDTRKEIRDKILVHQAKISERELPLGWSVESIDFVNRLLKRNKESRLGYNGIQELKKHEWLSNINWKKLSRKQITPPFIPGIITQSLDYQKQMQNTAQTLPNQQTQMLLRTMEIQNLFKDYSDSKKAKKGPRS